VPKRKVGMGTYIVSEEKDHILFLLLEKKKGEQRVKSEQ